MDGCLWKCSFSKCLYKALCDTRRSFCKLNTDTNERYLLPVTLCIAGWNMLVQQWSCSRMFSNPNFTCNTSFHQYLIVKMRILSWLSGKETLSHYTPLYNKEGACNKTNKYYQSFNHPSITFLYRLSVDTHHSALHTKLYPHYCELSTIV